MRLWYLNCNLWSGRHTSLVAQQNLRRTYIYALVFKGLEKYCMQGYVNHFYKKLGKYTVQYLQPYFCLASFLCTRVWSCYTRVVSYYTRVVSCCRVFLMLSRVVSCCLVLHSCCVVLARVVSCCFVLYSCCLVLSCVGWYWYQCSFLDQIDNLIQIPYLM